MSLKERFLHRPDLVVKRVEFTDVPGWADEADVYVRVMSGRERNEYEQFTIRLRGAETVIHREDVWAKVAVLSCCDAEGKRLFADADLAAVSAKSGRALKCIYDASAELNLLFGDKADAEPKDPNSPAVAGSGSCATCAGTSACPPSASCSTESTRAN